MKANIYLIDFHILETAFRIELHSKFDFHNAINLLCPMGRGKMGIGVLWFSSQKIINGYIFMTILLIAWENRKRTEFFCWQMKFGVVMYIWIRITYFILRVAGKLFSYLFSSGIILSPWSIIDKSHAGRLRIPAPICRRQTENSRTARIGATPICGFNMRSRVIRTCDEKYAGRRWNPVWAPNMAGRVLVLRQVS